MINPTVNLGPVVIHLYGLIIATAIYVGWVLSKQRARMYKIPGKIFEDPILFIPLVLAIIGARLYHVLSSWDYYSHNFILVFNISSGGLGIWGALFGGLLGFFPVSKLKGIPILSILDLIAPPLILAQALGRIGNYINQEGFGPPTSLPWGVFIDPAKRPYQFLENSFFHPTFFYEATLDLLIFVVLMSVSKRFNIPGQLFALYLILYSLSRFLVEFYRIDTWTVGTFKIAQILGFAVFILGLYLLFFPRKRT